MILLYQRFAQKIFRTITWRIPNLKGDKSIYLTFDDGPTPQITEWVLDTLDKYNAKATFFCIAKNIDKHPELYKKIIERGHSVGNHTYSHINGWNTNHEEYMNDISLADQFVDSMLFRPPYGKLTPKQIFKLRKNRKIILWSVLSMDYSKSVTPRQCEKNVISNIFNGSIVVFHDSEKAYHNLRFALPRVLQRASEQGYKFKKIEQ